MIHNTYADNATVTIAGIIVSQYPVCLHYILYYGNINSCCKVRCDKACAFGNNLKRIL